MIPEQLDLFGGPPKPPKQIKVEEGPAVIMPEPTPAVPEDSPALAATDIAADEALLAEHLPDAEVAPDVEPAPVAEAVPHEPAEMPEPAEDDGEAWIADDQEAWHDAADDTEAEGQDEEDGAETTGIAEAWLPEPSPIAFEEDKVVQVDIAMGTSQPKPASSPADETTRVSTKATSQVPFIPEPGNIPPDEVLFKRQYYSMRETATMFNISHSMLRFWENEFDVLQPRKNRKGDRYFRPVDIKNLQVIMHLLKVRKFTIEGAREYLRHHNKAVDTFELIQRLEKLKTFLHELKAHL